MSAPSPRPIYCPEAADLVSAVVGRCESCCDSCHEDADQFPGEWPLMEGVLRDGRTYRVCCAVKRGLQAADLHDEDATYRMPL